MAEDYSRFAADMARASANASLDALRRQVCELNRRVDQIESRLASERKDQPISGMAWRDSI
jgi:uncharacterized protein YceH (UPF0502 family)